MRGFKLAKDVSMQTIALKVKNREKMIEFYKKIVGFTLKNEENNLSIFSAHPCTSRLLILEEMEGKDELKKEQVLTYFSILLPTEAEFLSLAQRLLQASYPIERIYQKKKQQVLQFFDPEGNKVEVVWTKAQGFFEDNHTLSLEELSKKSEDVYTGLSREVRIHRAVLKVKNVQQSMEFYHSVLGMTAAEDEENTVYMNDGKFHLLLEEAEEFVPIKEHYLGIDFFENLLENHDSILQLKQHLEAAEKEFYIDSKQSILTIYDPSGIEWWFLRKNS